MNEVERMLDDFLHGKDYPYGNVKVHGRSGFGKTERIMAWAEAQENINFVVFDAALMSIGEIDNQKLIFSSAEIDRMDLENTVVFFDNYHLIKPEVSEELNLFFNERKVADLREQSGYRKLENVLFSVVAVTT